MRHLTFGFVLAFVLSGCAGNLTPKQQVDRYDRVAYTALRTFQTAEQNAYHAKLAWPTADQHQQVGATLSKAYTLVIAVAQAGIDLQPDQPLPAQLLASIDDLTRLVADVVALARGAPANVQAAASDAQQKVVQLTAAVKGTR